MSETNNTTVVQGAAETTGFRIRMIRMGLEAEMIGMRLTAKAPKCFSIIAKEFGIKVPRGSGDEGKRAAYETFCKRFGFEPKPAKQKVVLP